VTLRVVCFDLGGVLVRICRSWEQAARHAGTPPPHPLWSQPRVSQARSEAVHSYQTGKIESSEFFRQVAELSEGHYTPSDVERMHHAWTQEEYPGVAEVVGELAQLTSTVSACLSNTNHAHWVRLSGSRDSKRAGALATQASAPEYPTVATLQHKLASHLLGVAKPSARIYALAEEIFGCLPEQILFFDDLPDNLAAASARGWQVAHIDHTGDTALQIRSHLVHYGILR
jgi:glucose-1-phosphatase